MLFKKIFSLLLCVALLFTAGCSKKEDNNAENPKDNNGIISEYADTNASMFDEKNIVLTFPVLSDIHLNGSFAVEYSYNKAVRAINLSKEFSVNKKLDLVCATGDLVDCTNSKVMVQYGNDKYPGTYEEQYAIQSVKERDNLLKVLLDTKSNYSQFFYCLGNHDGGNREKATLFVEHLSGKNNENFDFFYGADLDTQALYVGNRHIKVNGYNFLALDMSADSSDFEWLKNKLDEILAEDKAQTIFLLHHFRPVNMTFASAGQSADLRDFLEAYPQVIVFGGHTHTYVDFDNALMQSEKGFISVDTGAVRYVTTDSIVSTTGAESLNTTKEDVEAQSTGLLVEVDKNGNVRIGRYNYAINAKVGSSWVIPKVKDDGSRDLLYTKKREGSDVKPVFSEGDASAKLSGKLLIIKFPAAYTNQKLYRYDINITDNATGKKLKTKYASSLFYKFATPADMPKNYTIRIETDGTLSDDLTVKINGVDSWINKGEPIVINTK